MILPNLLPRQSRRDKKRHANLARQNQNGLPGQFETTITAATSTRETLTRPRVVTTSSDDKDGRRPTTTGRSSAASSTQSTSGSASSASASRSSASSSSLRPSRTLSTLTSSSIAPSRFTSTVLAESSTTRSLIVWTTFPSDFPIPTQKEVVDKGAGRGFVFIPDSQLADSSELPTVNPSKPTSTLSSPSSPADGTVLLFATFCAGFFVFTILLIQLTKLSDKRRGNAKTDQMVGEDMRWAEGREVVEKRIIWESAVVPPVPYRPGVKLARRQSLGNKS